MIKNFHVTQKAIISSGGKVLLLKKKVKSGRILWDIPGGRVDADETPDDALARELREELPSLKKYNVGPVVYIDCVQNYAVEMPDVGLFLIFRRIDVDDAQLTIDWGDEHQGYGWLSRSDIENLRHDADPFITPGYKAALLSFFEC